MSAEATSQPFYVDRAKGGRAGCKGCKDKCPNGELRMAKVVPSPYGEGQSMKSWFHVDCFINALLKQRPATKRIDSIDDIGNWPALTLEDQKFLLEKINEMEKLYAEKNSGKYTAKVILNQSTAAPTPSTSKESPKDVKPVVQTKDNDFSEFNNLCKKISAVDAYTEKTAVINHFFTKGTDGESFKGEIVLWCKFLLPQVSKRVYNLKSKQLVKLFSRIFNTYHEEMLEHLEQGDVAKTVKHFFKKSKSFQPATESTLRLQDIEDFLEDLSKLTKEDEQTYHFKKIVKRCTTDDLTMVIRLIKCDLRINAGPKHILDGVHPDAYSVFQTSRDLGMVLDRVLPQSSGVKHKDAFQKTIKAQLQIMTPVLPMLAEACKSVEMAMKKCPNGMFSEIKYDGERVQVHKQGKEFKYFSRALKPVMPHKVNHFKDYLPQAFPEGEDLILDAEVLMVDVNTGKPLPFGTLGIHKQSEFKDAQVCLFVFDCLYYNGKVLVDLPIRKRREILHEHMVEVENHVMFSEQKLIRKPADLASMIAEVLQLGLEGLVLKDLESTYEPGKRHWLKVKKDYLFGGAMADTADLVVLGAWFGTGKKGGMMSVFLMGCHDKRRNKWVTVTKVHTGHDDSTLERLQKELGPLMVKISQDSSRVPSWLDCNKGLIPDYVANDPKGQPVWEITGTEFTKANIHTADGISVRFPRVTRIRDDKNWETATNLDELKHLYKTSKEKTDVTLLNKIAETASKDESDDRDEPPKKKVKESPKKEAKIDSFFTKKSKEKVKVKEEKLEEVEGEKKSAIEMKVKRESGDSVDSEVKKEKSDKESKYDKDRESRSSKRDRDEYYESKSRDNHGSSKSRDKDRSSKRDGNESQETKSRDNHESKSRDRDKDRSSKRDRDESHESKSRDKDRHRSSDSKKRKSDELADSSDSKRHKSEHESRKDNSSESKKDKNKHRSSRDDKNDSSEIKEKRKELQLEPKNPLPEPFKGISIGFYPDFISFPEDERRHFERHWIGYGGKIVKSIKQMDVDYLIHANRKIKYNEVEKLKCKIPDNCRHVTKDWLYKCIKDKQIGDSVDFSVTVKPSKGDDEKL